MRQNVTMACTECKNRNYQITKNRSLHPDRLEQKKYCRFCGKHTLHKQTR